jgi:hypothetical protein
LPRAILAVEACPIELVAYLEHIDRQMGGFNSVKLSAQALGKFG